MTHNYLSLKRILEKDKNLTFLVGAGSSIDSPSCLPSGRSMMETIIKFACVEPLDIEGLRFEALVEYFREKLDNNLKIIDYFEQCNKPNIQHFFFAEMIKKGNFVVTTNFDYLIEHALLQSNVDKKDIIAVITKEDFSRFSNPAEQYRKGKKVLYKIHGSTKNIITDEDTRSSLIATTQALGLNKEGLNIFQVESFKKPLFDNISNNRSMIVVGYSGSDNFDIVPTLKGLNNLRDLIWVNHIENDQGREHVSKLEITDSKVDRAEKLDQLLLEIKSKNKNANVYRVDVNTSRLFSETLNFKPNIAPNNFSLALLDWIEKNVEISYKLHEMIKYDISSLIYHDLDRYDDSLRCANRLLQIAKKNEYQHTVTYVLNLIGTNYKRQGHFQKALEMYEEALNIASKLGNQPGQASVLTNIATIYCDQGKQYEALEKYKKALGIFDQIKNLSGKAECLRHIGFVLKNQKKYGEALKYYEKSLSIEEKQGNLIGKADCLINIGELYHALGDICQALRFLETGLRIAEELGNLEWKIAALSRIAEIHGKGGNIPLAIKMEYEILNIADTIGDRASKANCLDDLGNYYLDQGDFNEALTLLRQSLQINEKMGYDLQIAKNLSNIGRIYHIMGNYSEALKLLNRSIQIFDSLEDLASKSVVLLNISKVLFRQGKLPEALSLLDKEVIKLNQQLKDFAGQAEALNLKGMVYFELGDYQRALENLEVAFQILIKFDMANSPLASNIACGIQTVRARMGQYSY